MAIERQRAGKKHNAILVEIVRLRALRAWVGDVIQVKVEKRSRTAVIDARWKQRLRTDANSAVGHRRTFRNARQIHHTRLAVDIGSRQLPRPAAEINHVARLGRGDVDTESRRIVHAVNGEHQTDNSLGELAMLTGIGQNS